MKRRPPDGVTPEGLPYWVVRLPTLSEQLDAMSRPARTRDPREGYSVHRPTRSGHRGAE